MSGDHWYRGYGLLFRSQLDLPELTPSGPGTADVEITLGDAPSAALEMVDPAESAHPGFTKTPVGDVLRLPDLATILINEGRKIVIQLADGSDPGLLRLYLIGSVFGMVFHQRKQLVLHGAAIAHPSGLSIFVGASGAGKSTLAAHLGKRGHAVLADDTLPLLRKGDEFLAWPGSRVFKLWRDALDALGEVPDDLAQVGERYDKFFYQNPAVADDAPMPLSEVIVLDRAEDQTLHLHRVKGLEALQLLTVNAYRPEYVAYLGQETAHFQLTAALTGAVRVLRLTRPWDVSKMPDVIARLEAHWAGAPLDPPLPAPTAP
ncbi:MAG: hypothetical protein AAGB15_02165 [Pseudomonadota bacterium]